MSNPAKAAAFVIVGLIGCLVRTPDIEAQTLSGRLAALLEEADVSGSVIVTKGETTVLAAGYGMANRELSVPNTPTTKFRIGSVTKQFTAMAILILQDRGRLRVEDRVADHVPGVPESWGPLTIHQLLTHTSGIMHSWALPGFAETMAVPTTLDETLELFHGQPLLFEPGSSFLYSGVGYFLLAKIIEVVSGRRYEEFLAAEVFEPLGMHDTGADQPWVILGDRASGYVRDEDGNTWNAPAISMPILTGGGNLYSTAEDLARWGRALSAHLLLSEEAYGVMYEPEREGYAYGWFVGQTEGRKSISHSGGVPGFNAFIGRIPEEEICVVVLTNLTPGQAGPLARSLTAAALAESSGPGGSS